MSQSSSSSSSKKEALSTYHTHAEQDRVRSEQEYIKQKGREVASVATKAKDGSISMPSTEEITTTLQRGQDALTNLQESERGQHIGRGGDRVVEDIKRVLADQQTIIGEKNEGDVLQNIVRDFWALLQELQQNSDLKIYLEEWQSTVTSVFSSGDFSQFFQQTGDLFTSMKDTDEFLGLTSELVDLVKIVVAEATEKAVEGDTAAKEEFKRQREMERRRVARELRYTLSSITRNEMWRRLVQRSKAKVSQAQAATRENTQHADQLFYNLRESPNFKTLLGDFKVLIQRLVGNTMSVDPLFDYSKKAISDIIDDEDLSAVVDEMVRLLPAIAEDTAMLDDPNVQRELDQLSRRADDVIMRLRNNPNIKGAKEESIEVANAIKSEASNMTLLTDLKVLWRDLSSGKSGEVIDPDVLRSLRQMIVPLLVEHLNNVPLPSVSDEFTFLGKYFYTLDQMKISLPELIPENIHLRFEYEMDANPLELEAKNQHTYLYLQASNLQLHLHDCHFTYERRTVPRHADSGIFDVDTVGEGLTAWLKMEIKSDTSKGQYLDVLKSDVKISRFHITFRDSKHDKLYEMLTHMFSRKIKSGVIEMIHSKFKTFGSYFNTQIIALIDQAKTSSANISKLAKDKTEQARQGIEDLKLKAKEKKDSEDAQDTKQEVKSTAKQVIGMASEKVQERLDDAKVQIERKKREKEMDRAISGPSADELLCSTPNLVDIPVLSPTPAVVTPDVSDSPIPFTFTTEFIRPTASRSLLGDSDDTRMYFRPQFNAASHILPSESVQFSPNFAPPMFNRSTVDYQTSRPNVTPSSSTVDLSPEWSWVSAKPEELEEKRTNVQSL